MEVGAVKHQLNNEIIRLKKSLNQAKVQLIHKLTRKANSLKTQKKVPEKLQTKVHRKSEAAVAEILILKKINAKDLARFAISHTGKLENFINKPTVDNERVYAKVLLHKAMNEKYKHLRSLFSNMPLDKLLMTRKERLELKKADKEKSNKKDNKNKIKPKRGDNDDENNRVSMMEDQKQSDDSPMEDNSAEEFDSADENNFAEEDNSADEDKSAEEDDSADDDDEVHVDQDNSAEEHYSDNEKKEPQSDNEQDSEEEHSKNHKIDASDESDNNESVHSQSISHKNAKITNISEVKCSNKLKHTAVKTTTSEEIPLPGPTNKTKLQEHKKKDRKTKAKTKKPSKINRQQNNESQELKPPVQAKIVDSFFMTATGDHYLTLAEPRGPDEVKEEHHRGNRKMRRAEKFGKHIKPYMKNNSYSKESKYEKHSYNRKNDSYRGNSRNIDSSANDNLVNFDNRPSKKSFDDRPSKKSFDNQRVRKMDKDARIEDKIHQKDEKLHPSWEAKKQKSGIVQFQGKKMSFS